MGAFSTPSRPEFKAISLSMKIVGGRGGQFAGRQGGDAAGFDYYDVVGVLHRAFNFQEGFLRDDQAQFLE
jgi:hypothetical protein